MNKNAKQPSNVKKKHDGRKHLQRGGQTGAVRPAEKSPMMKLKSGRLATGPERRAHL
jgi:hypothetical protein